MLKETGKHCAVLITFCLLHTVECDIKTHVKNNVREIEERSRRLYGDTQTRPIKQWELDAEDEYSYPNGDGQKLAVISHRWITYYRCTSRVVDAVTSSGHRPSVTVTVYEGEVARLACDLCVAPGEDDRVTWLYAESLHNVKFTPLNTRSTMICDVNVTIYNVQRRDAGLYRCRLASSAGGLVVLQVLDDHHYDVITVESDRGSHATVESTRTSKLITFTSWSPWGECSGCGRAARGTRRRYGMCYVRLNNTKHSATERTRDSIFEEFPNGIPCASWLLPAAHRNNSTVTNRRNVIMTESCKSPCQQVFEVRSASGELLERANNSNGVYSARQSPPPQPPQPPPPARHVIFAQCGVKLTLKCPGTTLRDIPITWRRGTQDLVAETLGAETGGRVQLDARDHIVFVSVEDGDAGVYSCWQSCALAGVLKLEVWRDARLANGRPIVVACLTVLAIALHFAVRLLHSKMRHAR